jgi:protein TonB
MQKQLHNLLAVSCMLGAVFACAQDAPQPNSAPTEPQPAGLAFTPVYNVGAGVRPPELIPLEVTFDPAEMCSSKVKGRVVLSFIIDSNGVAQDLGFQTATGTDLDGVAHKLVEADRFKPAMRGGVPVAVSEQAELWLEACNDQVNDSNGKKRASMKLIAQPRQHFFSFPLDPADLKYALPEPAAGVKTGEALERIGNGVQPPKLVNNVAASYSEAARGKKINADVGAKFIVDPLGIPRCIRITKPAGYDLEEQTLKAVRQYRFKPAMKNGIAVPVLITVVVSLRLY